MGQLLNSGQVGNIGTNSMKLIREDVINKWDKLGFLDGLAGYSKDNVAQLFENQASYLINEQTTSTDSGSFETVVFPIVRRVFSKLLANDIVSVQALNLPIGKLFYFVPEISTNRPGFNSVDGGFQPSTPSTVDLYDQFYEGRSGDPEGGLFDASRGTPTVINMRASGNGAAANGNIGLFDSTGAFSAATEDMDTRDHRYIVLKVDSSALVTTGTMTGADGQLADSEAFLASLNIYLTGNTNAATAAMVADATGPTYGMPCNVNADVATADTYLRATGRVGNNVIGNFVQGVANVNAVPFINTAGVLSGGTRLKYRMITQKYGQGIVDAAGDVYVEIDFGCPACPNCQSVAGRGYGNPGQTPGGDGGGIMANTFIAADGAANGPGAMALVHGLAVEFKNYATLELEDNMSEVTFRLDSVTVAVTERKLRATWSPELAQDVSAFHNIDAEAELTALLSEQVAAEIDREILKDLRNGAAWSLRWDANGWKRSNNAQGYAAYTQKDWNQTLITTINQLSAQIHKSTLRGGANWIVCSAEASAIFDDLEYFHVSNASPDQDSYNMGIEKVGSLSGRYTVYRDPYFPAGSVLIGHKGKSLLDTGYVYAPYVPLQLTPTMYNPFNFAPIKGIMTRYAKKMVNNRFYGKITIDGIQTFSVNELR